eukprot:TRINITY_DN1049_c0_g1_i1.p1 TRINITY_DN1049_c0_g1~~TRINITY_DN1049_c0_g1_i1.p1  ORF type:complete len:608 (-),score=130.50 TRINITY_DN1049_c0_g1_i1:45-1868(-)
MVACSEGLMLLRRNPQMVKAAVAAGVQSTAVSLVYALVVGPLKTEVWGDRQTEHQSEMAMGSAVFSAMSSYYFGAFSDKVDRRLAVAIWGLCQFLPAWSLLAFGFGEEGLWAFMGLQILGGLGVSSNVMLVLAHDMTRLEDREFAFGLFYAVSTFVSLMGNLPLVLIVTLKVIPNSPSMAIWLQAGLSLTFFVLLASMPRPVENDPAQPGAQNVQPAALPATDKMVVEGSHVVTIVEDDSAQLGTQNVQLAELPATDKMVVEDSCVVTIVEDDPAQPRTQNVQLAELPATDKMVVEESCIVTISSFEEVIPATDKVDKAKAHLAMAEVGKIEPPPVVAEENAAQLQRCKKGDFWALVLPFRMLCEVRTLGMLCIVIVLLDFSKDLVFDIGGQFFMQSLDLIENGTHEDRQMVTVLSSIPSQVTTIPTMAAVGWIAKRYRPMQMLWVMIPVGAVCVMAGCMLNWIPYMWFLPIVCATESFADLTRIPMALLITELAPKGRLGEAMGVVGMIKQIVSFLGNAVVAGLNPVLQASELHNPLWIYYPICALMRLLTLLALPLVATHQEYKHSRERARKKTVFMNKLSTLRLTRAQMLPGLGTDISQKNQVF